jgi:hypothetical protein
VGRRGRRRRQAGRAGDAATPARRRLAVGAWVGFMLVMCAKRDADAIFTRKKEDGEDG